MCRSKDTLRTFVLSRWMSPMKRVSDQMEFPDGLRVRALGLVTITAGQIMLVIPMRMSRV